MVNLYQSLESEEESCLPLLLGDEMVVDESFFSFISSSFILSPSLRPTTSHLLTSPFLTFVEENLFLSLHQPPSHHDQPSSHDLPPSHNQPSSHPPITLHFSLSHSLSILNQIREGRDEMVDGDDGRWDRDQISQLSHKLLIPSSLIYDFIDEYNL